jgi:hypothetical protein
LSVNSSEIYGKLRVFRPKKIKKINFYLYMSFVMEYGKTCIPGRLDNLPTVLTVADVKLYSGESHGIAAFEPFFQKFITLRNVVQF